MNIPMSVIKQRGIYAITHKKTGKTYVGQSRRMMTRLSDHVSALYKGAHVNKRLQKLFDSSCGVEAFIISVLEEVESLKELCPAERKWIARYGDLALNGGDKRRSRAHGVKRLFSVYLPSDVLRRIDKVASDFDRSTNWTIELLITEALNARKVK